MPGAVWAVVALRSLWSWPLSKCVYGHQFVAKVATDDESLMALVKTIQLEARKQGPPIVNLWMQCQDPNEFVIL